MSSKKRTEKRIKRQKRESIGDRVLRETCAKATKKIRGPGPEEWRDIPDYEGLYQVSNLGRVKELAPGQEQVIDADNEPGEEWKDIAGCGGEYQVSNKGRVRKLLGEGKMWMLTQYPNDDGYLWVSVMRNGAAEAVFVHVLVAEAFLPKPWLN